MSTYRPTDDDVSIAEWLADDPGDRPTTPPDGPRGAAAPAPVRPPVPEPVYARRQEPEYTQQQGPVEESGYSEARQRERYGGLNWGAGFFGWLVAAGITLALSGVVAAGVVSLGLTDKLLPTGAETPSLVNVAAAAATAFGVLLVALYAGGYVAGRMSRFDGGKQGVAVWLISLVLGGAGVGLALLGGSRYDTFDQLRLPTMPVPPEAAALTGVGGAVAVVFVLLLAAAVGGKVGCRYHRKVDDAAYV